MQEMVQGSEVDTSRWLLAASRQKREKVPGTVDHPNNLNARCNGQIEH
jgi:hypothetical protein